MKYVFKSFSLLSLLTVLLLSSCSTSREYSNRSTKKHRSTQSPSKRKVRKKVYTSSSSVRSSIVITAKKYIGKPYVYGGKQPSSGFDCSGFTSHVFKQNGVSVSGSSKQQSKQGRQKSMKSLKKGDLVFFGKKNKVSHVAIVASVSNNKIKVIHSTSSRGVVIDDISSSDYWQKKYLFGRDVLQ